MSQKIVTIAIVFILLLGFASIFAVTPDVICIRHHCRTSSSSTTTTTTTTTGIVEQIGDVFGVVSGCPMLTGVPDEVTRIDQNFTAKDSNGVDAWQLQFVQSGNDNESSVMFFTSDRGTHTAGELYYANSTLIYNQTILINAADGGTANPGQPLVGDVIQGQFIDFYTGNGNNADGGQIFWYTIGATNGELFTYNFQNAVFPLNFTVQSDSVRILPLDNASSVTFTAPNPSARLMDTQLGQQSNSFNIPIDYGVGIDPCATPIQLQQFTSANLCSVNQAEINNDTSIGEDWVIN